MTLYAIPCTHPNVENGTFYCEPPFSAEHMRPNFLFVVVDAARFFAKLEEQEGAPGNHIRILQHAEWQYNQRPMVESFFKTSIENPREIGLWQYSTDSRLQMLSGDAAILKIAKMIGIPYFPIAVTNSIGNNAISEFKSRFEYRGPTHPAKDLGPPRPNFKPEWPSGERELER